MILSVYGAGYVGLVTAVCLSKLGHRVICVDINVPRIAKLLQGQCPIHEDQLPELLKEQLAQGNLEFTADLSYAIKQANVHFIATGTPSLADGSADLSQVYAVATQIARDSIQDGLVVVKSTVPVGTGEKLEVHVQQESKKFNNPYLLDIVSNPEFLREGRAVYDFLHAERIIIGGNTSALQVLKNIYNPLVEQGTPLICMSRKSAELTKYTANAMLACRISFINQISCIAEKVGANIDEIKRGIGSDSRIGPQFLEAGIGFGGSCFPKDNRALVQTAQSLKVDASLLSAIEKINALQKKWVMEKLTLHFKGKLTNRIVGIWGLAFKPDTEDMREASSLVIIENLLRAGALLRLYDPIALPTAQAIVRENAAITWCHSAEEVCAGPSLDALVIATEWEEFKQYPLLSLSKLLGEAPLIDGRNCFDLASLEQAKIAYYYSVGRPLICRESHEILR